MARSQAEAQQIAALVQGDRAAFARIFVQHNAAMVRVAQGICPSRAVAEEIAQEAWRGGCGNLNSRDKWIFRVTAA